MRFFQNDESIILPASQGPGRLTSTPDKATARKISKSHSHVFQNLFDSSELRLRMLHCWAMLLCISVWGLRMCYSCPNVPLLSSDLQKEYEQNLWDVERSLYNTYGVTQMKECNALAQFPSFHWASGNFRTPQSWLLWWSSGFPGNQNVSEAPESFNNHYY